MTATPHRAGIVAPLPLLLLFGAFLAAIAYLVAASLTRRRAPVFAISSPERSRPVNWERTGDTLTIDATDGDSWRHVSLARGRALDIGDTIPWEIAIQRYRVITPTGLAIADLGDVPFDGAHVPSDARFVPTKDGQHPENAAIDHWYRYNLLTHLLEPNGHVFAIRSATGTLYKVAIVSYYCPKLVAGCLTIRYAPLPR
jgi:hypothetical protein